MCGQGGLLLWLFDHISMLFSPSVVDFTKRIFFEGNFKNTLGVIMYCPCQCGSTWALI